MPALQICAITADGGLDFAESIGHPFFLEEGGEAFLRRNITENTN